MTVALLEIGNHIPYEQYDLAVLVFENPEDFDYNVNKVLTQMSHVCRGVGPKNWKVKNTKAEFEEIEAEDLNKIGSKIIKEAGREGYLVTRDVSSFATYLKKTHIQFIKLIAHLEAWEL